MRGRGAPPPAEGEGPREGQRMAIGQLAPPAADENNTPKATCQPPPPPFLASPQVALLPQRQLQMEAVLTKPYPLETLLNLCALLLQYETCDVHFQPQVPCRA